jgi:tetratricopeptide (TPR) repeat protein
VTALDTRAGKQVSPAQRRADLTRIAIVQRDHLNDAPAAIAAWQRVASTFGDDAENVGALTELFAGAGRWSEMADLLERTSSGDIERTTGRLNRLGQALAEHLGQPARALSAYRAALAIDSVNAVARAGLVRLLDDAAQRKAAADALATSYRESQDWPGYLQLVPARLADAADDRTRLALLREAAYIRQTHLDDGVGALAHLVEAFPLAPRDGVMEGQILALAERTGNHRRRRRRAGARHRGAGRRSRRGRAAAGRAPACSTSGGDPTARARRVRGGCTRTTPRQPVATAGVIRLAPANGNWADAALALGRYAVAKERLDDGLWSSLEAAARAAGAIDGLTAALESAAAQLALPPTVAAAWWGKLALLHRDARGDRAAAISAFGKALAAGGDRADTLRALADLLRAGGATPALLDVLRRLADADPRDLDVLVEAADTASRLGDRDVSLTILGQVLGRATAAWRGSTTITSARPAESVVRWAVDGLVELHKGAGRVRAPRSISSSSRRACRSIWRPAASCACAPPRWPPPSCATTPRRSTCTAACSPTAPAISRSSIAAGRAPRRRGPRRRAARPAAAPARARARPARRLELRLDIARLVGIVEEKGGRLEALTANLDDQPGHDASVDAVASYLAGKGQHRALADLLEVQATRLESGGDAPKAARLWARFAGVAERDTRESDRAIAGHRRVVTLAPTPDSFRALARLQLDRGQPAQAVPWFESLLSTVPGGERTGVVHQLAKAHLAAEHPDRAIAAIESNLDDREPALELRLMLADLYRSGAAVGAAGAPPDALARSLRRRRPRARARARGRGDLHRQARRAGQGDPGARARARRRIRPTRS